MSRHRSLSTDISSDARVAELAESGGALPMLLYTSAIPHADDWGRLTGDARQFKLLVCPGIDVTTREVAVALEQIAAVGLWRRYVVDGRTWLAFPSAAWYRHQSYIRRDKRDAVGGSRIPAPPVADAAAVADDVSEASAGEHRASPRNTEDCRKTPKITANHRQSPLLFHLLSLLQQSSSLARVVISERDMRADVCADAAPRGQLAADAAPAGAPNPQEGFASLALSLVAPPALVQPPQPEPEHRPVVAPPGRQGHAHHARSINHSGSGEVSGEGRRAGPRSGVGRLHRRDGVTADQLGRAGQVGQGHQGAARVAARPYGAGGGDRRALAPLPHPLWNFCPTQSDGAGRQLVGAGD